MKPLRRSPWTIFRWRGLALALAVAALPACRLTSLPIWTPAASLAPATLEVEQVRDILYCDGLPADDFRHRLDLYLPKGKKDFPVVVLIHGGAWITGDNRHFGLNSSVGEFLASQGIGAVLPNYRLSPGIKHPEHIKDVARAFAWTRSHIAEQGGSPEQIFLVGHSAGGHLVSLLATDDSYLKAEGLRTADIKGVIAFSGVYRIPSGKQEVALGGVTPASFRLEALVPFRGGSGGIWALRTGIPGIPIRLNVFGSAFGDDPQVREQASPLSHVRPGLPPFLILSAEKDLPMLNGMAEEFHQALVDQGCAAELLKVEKRNHCSIMYNAITPDDPAARAMLEFIQRTSAAR